MEKERIKKLRDKIKDRSYFYKPKHFVPIYEVKRKAKETVEKKGAEEKDKNKRELPATNNNVSTAKKKKRNLFN